MTQVWLPSEGDSAYDNDTHVAGIGPNANSARQQAFEALLSTNDDHQREFNAGRLGQPTIRIVKPGTFTDYRRWRGETLNTGVGQVKVPAVMVDLASLKWLEERVMKEFPISPASRL